jgi:hypothetical protein
VSDNRMISKCGAVGRMRIGKGKLKDSEKTHPSATLSTTFACGKLPSVLYIIPLYLSEHALL